MRKEKGGVNGQGTAAERAMLAPWETQSASLPTQKGNRVLFLAAHHCVTLPHSYIELQIDSSEL